MGNQLPRQRTIVAILLTLLLAGSTSGLHSSEKAQAKQSLTAAGVERVGRPWTGPLGLRESVAEIMQREAERRARGVPAVIREGLPVRLRPRRDLPQNPNSPAVSQWPPSAGAPKLREETTPLTPQTLGVSFTGATLADSGFVPPDSMGAAGPTQFVVMVNGRIRSFNKESGAADGVLDASTNVFFNSVRNSSSTSDPRVRYDRLTQRWFLVIINVSTPNRILLAVSDASSQGVISGGTVFTFFFIPIDTTPPTISSTCLADYPTLGVDANALYVGTNNFCGSPSQTFDSTDGYVVRKTSVLGAGPLVVTVFRALSDASPVAAGPFTPQGVDNFDPAATEGYFIGVDLLTFGTLMLRRVSNPGGTPSISANIAITVPTTTFPENVPHLGMTGKRLLDALDDRLFAAHFRSGRLWTAHNIEVNASGAASTMGGRTGVRWYELEGVASPGTPSVRQSGTIFDPASSPRFFWIPTVMVSGQGHTALGFSTAGTDFRADAATVGRLSGDTLGTTQTVALYTASSTAYNVQVANPQRWGDYSYTSLDPNDDMTMWTIQEFCNANNSWGVRVVKLLAPPPATPSSASTSVPAGQSSVDVTITGTSTSGSGFYDPGPGTGFTHISATVSGGVVVNSVTFNTPTSVTLNLNTTGASPGAKDVTITNPDGQFATGSGILTVTSTAGFTFSNSGAITINDGISPPTIATPYPSTITVIGLEGPITKVVAQFNSYSHAVPDDVDVLLVGPTGATAIVMSDVGGSSAVAGINLTLDDGAASPLADAGPLASGTFQPTNVGAGDSFPSPAPAPSGGSALSVFNGTNPNGTWSLYVVDDSTGNAGSFAGGWALVIQGPAPKKRKGQVVSE